jgi:hypothetical protein
LQRSGWPARKFVAAFAALAVLSWLGPVSAALGAAAFDRVVQSVIGNVTNTAPEIGAIFEIDITGDSGSGWVIGTTDVYIAVNGSTVGTFHFDAVRAPVSGPYCGGASPCANLCPPLSQNVSGQCGACACRYTFTPTMPYQLQDGDRVDAWAVASQGALPEIDTSNDSAFLVYRTAGVPASPLPGWTLAVAPNPSQAAMRVEFSMPHAGRVEIGVLDVTGRRVRALARGAGFPAGKHGLAWDGRDDHGRACGPGVYTVVLRAQGTRLVRRVALLR